MRHVAVQRASDLEPAARAWLKNVLGREVEDNENVTVMAWRPHPAPVGPAREAAAARLRHSLDEVSRKPQAASDAELESAIDEAMNDVRRWKP